MLEGEEGNGFKEIYDVGDFGVFCIDNGYYCLVVIGEVYMFVMLGGVLDGIS